MTEYVVVPKEIIDRFPEINTSNYGHDDACHLNAWAIELALAAAPQQAAEPIGHVWPDDLKRLETTECRVDCYSVPMGRADGAKTVPLYSHPPAQPEQPAPIFADVRAAFERWASDDGKWLNSIERNGDHYMYMSTQEYWRAWQACAGLTRPAAPDSGDGL